MSSLCAQIGYIYIEYNNVRWMSHECHGSLRTERSFAYALTAFDGVFIAHARGLWIFCTHSSVNAAAATSSSPSSTTTTFISINQLTMRERMTNNSNSKITLNSCFGECVLSFFLSYSLAVFCLFIFFYFFLPCLEPISINRFVCRRNHHRRRRRCLFLIRGRRRRWSVWFCSLSLYRTIWCIFPSPPASLLLFAELWHYNTKFIWVG